ncbi:MAG: helicase-related protein [Castellaniella sp.]
MPGIICTQPRTLTAIRNIIQLVEVSDYGTFLKIGETVGWSTRYNKLRAKRYGLLSATIGTLAQQLKVWTDEEVMAAYKFILIDETHERDLETDMVMYMLKNFLTRNGSNPACPFVMLMSATFEPQQFISYYGLDPIDNFIWCEGRAFGIDQHWAWNQDRTINDYPRTAATIVGRIVKNEDNNEPDEDGKGDILIFMPGAAEIKATAKWLEQTNAELVAKNLPPVSVLSIDSPAQRDENLSFRLLDIPLAEHRVAVGGNIYPAGRRVVISTNIAETGLTIPSLKYVIDSGYNKEVEFNPNYGLASLIVRPAPQSRIKQRMGRAGRKFKGHFYPLYPKYLYERLPVNQLPTILLGDTSLIAMGIIVEQLRFKAGTSTTTSSTPPSFSIADIDMVDVPAPDALWAALEKLYALGMIAPKSLPFNVDAETMLAGDYTAGFGLTKLGVLAGQFRMIPPESIRMILAGYVWGASILDLISIAAYLIVGPTRFEGVAKMGEDEAEPANESRALPFNPANESRAGGGDDAEFIEAEYVGAAPSSRGRRQNHKAPPKRKVKPGINWTKLYALGEPGFLGGKGQLYRTRMLIGDEFIDGIFILNAAKRALAEVENTDMVLRLFEWATEYRVNWHSLMAFFAARDEIIEQMLVAGFDVFANEGTALINAHPNNFIDTLARLKHCIYDGYRCNILRLGGDGVYRSGGVPPFNPADGKSLGGVEIATPSIFKKDEVEAAAESEYGWTLKVRPKVLIHAGLSVQQLPAGNYEVIAGAVSAMDGFVNIDDTFLA